MLDEERTAAGLPHPNTSSSQRVSLPPLFPGLPPRPLYLPSVSSLFGQGSHHHPTFPPSTQQRLLATPDQDFRRLLPNPRISTTRPYSLPHSSLLPHLQLITATLSPPPPRSPPLLQPRSIPPSLCTPSCPPPGPPCSKSSTPPLTLQAPNPSTSKVGQERASSAPQSTFGPTSSSPPLLLLHSPFLPRRTFLRLRRTLCRKQRTSPRTQGSTGRPTSLPPPPLLSSRPFLTLHPLRRRRNPRRTEIIPYAPMGRCSRKERR